MSTKDDEWKPVPFPEALKSAKKIWYDEHKPIPKIKYVQSAFAVTESGEVESVTLPNGKHYFAVMPEYPKSSLDDVSALWGSGDGSGDTSFTVTLPPIEKGWKLEKGLSLPDIVEKQTPVEKPVKIVTDPWDPEYGKAQEGAEATDTGVPPKVRVMLKTAADIVMDNIDWATANKHVQFSWGDVYEALIDLADGTIPGARSDEEYYDE
jgi:hypothetical protein